MKRDDDLIRELLLRVEAREGRPYDFQVEGYTEDQVNYHLALLVEHGFLEGKVLERGGGDDGTPRIVDTYIKRLTMEGHDFLDAVRNDDIWLSAREKIASTVGTTSLSVLKALALQYAKEKLGLP